MSILKIHFTFFHSFLVIIFLEAAPSSMEVLENRLKNYEKQDSTYIYTLFRLTDVYRQKMSENSKKHRKQALNSTEKLHFRQRVLKAYYLLGTFFKVERQYKKSLHYTLEALKISRILSDKTEEVRLLNLAGTLYQKIKNEEEAQNYLQKAFRLATSLRSQYLLAVTYTNLGLLYMHTKPIKAKDYFIKALEINRRAGEQEEIILNLLNLGYWHHRDNDLSQALTYYQQALKEWKIQKKNQETAAILFNNIGCVYTEMKDFKKAWKNLTKGYQFTRGIKSKYYEKVLLESMEEYYEAQKDFRQALIYHKKVSTLSDSLFNMAAGQKVGKIEVKAKLFEKERENIEHAGQFELLRKDRKTERVLIFCLTGLLFLLSFLMLLLQSRYRRHKKLLETRQTLIQADLEVKEKELCLKNQTLISSGLHIIQKNSLCKEIRKNINEMATRVDASHKTFIKRLLRLIDQNFNLEKDWNDFQNIFEQIYPDFLNHLQENIPQITSNEIRLCTLLRLNFNTKEIANMMGISPDSVKTARYRLRKKINLNREDSLTKFILTV